MKLNWIEVAHLGPFAFPTTLKLDPKVTVLTGANDTGKSSLLRAVSLLLSGKAAEVLHVNQERIDTFSGRWHDDPEFVCNAGFGVTQLDLQTKTISGGIQEGDEVVFTKRLNQNGSMIGRHVRRGTQTVSTGIALHKPPQALLLPTSAEVRDIIPLASPNDAEDKLLKLAFGQAFTQQQHEGQARPQRVTRIDRARRTLNERLKEILPPGLPLEFHLSDPTDKAQEISVSLVDPLRCFVSPGCRGLGVRRILSIMGALLLQMNPSQQTVILLDEPENSLHADAQHALRRLLERLAESPLIQVVYATHSPSMINPLRPSSIRVLERVSKNDRPTTTINNEAFRQSFLRVRSSLGITPSDSLLYAPVTIVVEGPSEVRAIPIALERLHKEGISEFADLEDVLGQIHFLEGGGDEFPYLCRLAKSQNARPIIFVDGDKRRVADSVTREYPDVPIVILDEHQEFENLVPVDMYLAAAANIHGLEPARVTPQALDAWFNAQGLSARMMFSKRVERWLQDVFETNLNKPRVMEEAIKDVPIGQLHRRPFIELMREMRRLLNDH